MSTQETFYPRIRSPIREIVFRGCSWVLVVVFVAADRN
jgi:hypothetical protein